MVPSENISGMEWGFDRMLGVVGIALALLALFAGLGATLAMDAKTKGELRFAQVCFAISALMLLFSLGVWDMSTDMNATKRVLIVASCSIVIGLMLAETMRWAKRRHEHAASALLAEKKKEQVIESKPTSMAGVDSDTKDHRTTPPINKPASPPKAAYVFGVPRTNAEIIARFNEIPAGDLNLRDLFVHDFTDRLHGQKVGGDLEPVNSDDSTKIPYFIVLEEDSNSKYIEFYVPFNQNLLGVIRSLAFTVENGLDTIDDLGVISKPRVGDSIDYDSRKSVFTRQVYIYSEADVNIDQLAELYQFFKSHNLQLQFRSNGYLEAQRLKQIIKQR